MTDANCSTDWYVLELLEGIVVRPSSLRHGDDDVKKESSWSLALGERVSRE